MLEGRDEARAVVDRDVPHEAEVVADEMVSELCITKEQHIQVVDFIQDAVKRHSTGLMPLTSAVVSMNCANPPGTGAQLGSHQVRR